MPTYTESTDDFNISRGGSAQGGAAAQISASVGRNGLNRYSDVMIVQRLINAKLPFPLARLPEDGMCGDNMIFAIETYQRRDLGTSLPDGRVDPGGATFRSLTASGSASSGAAAVASIDISVLLSRLLPRRTPWKFNTSAGGSTSASIFSFGGGSLFLRHDRLPSDERKLRFFALGLNATPPVGFLKNFKFSGAGSLKALPGTGVGHIFAGPRVSGELEFDDMRGFLNILSASAVTLGGVSLTIVFLGTIPVVSNLFAALGAGATIVPTPPGLAAGLLAIAEISKATGILVGTGVGVDVSLSALQGHTF